MFICMCTRWRWLCWCWVTGDHPAGARSVAVSRSQPLVFCGSLWPGWRTSDCRSRGSCQAVTGLGGSLGHRGSAFRTGFVVWCILGQICGSVPGDRGLRLAWCVFMSTLISCETMVEAKRGTACVPRSWLGHHVGGLSPCLVHRPHVARLQPGSILA